MSVISGDKRIFHFVCLAKKTVAFLRNIFFARLSVKAKFCCPLLQVFNDSIFKISLISLNNSSNYFHASDASYASYIGIEDNSCFYLDGGEDAR